jgi:FkbM family methyltransferase
VTAHQMGRPRLLTMRLLAWIWRFRTLSLSARLFGDLRSPCILKRRFLGYSIAVDVSRSSVQRLIYLEGERFVTERPLLRALARARYTVVDVGANIGYYMLLFESAVGAAGRIVAFEPEPDNLVELRANVEGNALNNVAIHPVAVGSRSGTVAFARGINGGVREDAGAMTGNEIQVPVVTLDDALTGPVDLIKIDVEGYEEEVLLGATKTLQAHRPALFVEIHPGLMTHGRSAEKVIDFLAHYDPAVEFYQPARSRSMLRKTLSRYFPPSGVERLPGREAVIDLCRRGLQDTFWAVCRAGRGR